jgi:hypothetical protein
MSFHDLLACLRNAPVDGPAGVFHAVGTGGQAFGVSEEEKA